MSDLPQDGISFSSTLNRKTYVSWSIPASHRKAFNIKDGDKVIVAFTVGNTMFRETRKITSGGEFLLPARVALLLKENASRQERVHFTVFSGEKPHDLKDLNKCLAEKVALSLSDSAAKRQARLAKAPKMPKPVEVRTWEFMRNADVIAEVLFLSKGLCHECRKKAPFLRKRDGSPYLEVHHKKPLADGGEDTVANAIALCPNCHRQAHHG